MLEEQYDVIMVGAGLAGLTAAQELRHAGKRVLVLEARDRLGGRAYTSTLAERDIELGGAIFTGSSRTFFAEMTRYGISFRVLPIPDRWSYYSRRRLHDSIIADLTCRMQEFIDRIFNDAFQIASKVHMTLVDRNRPGLDSQPTVDDAAGRCTVCGGSPSAPHSQQRGICEKCWLRVPDDEARSA
jgi:monoamine oxidase